MSIVKCQLQRLNIRRKPIHLPEKNMNEKRKNNHFKLSKIYINNDIQIKKRNKLKKNRRSFKLLVIRYTLQFDHWS